jgi:P63C domain-containing protein
MLAKQACQVLFKKALAFLAEKLYGYLAMKTDNENTEIQSLGGKARAERLTAEERSSIAQAAAEARWSKVAASQGNIRLPKATHIGELRIGSLSIPCAVLEDGTRVITQRGMFVAIGMNKNPSKGQTSIENRPGFVSANNLTPFITKELERSWTPIPFRLPKGAGGYKGNIAFGYKAEILPAVCHAYLDAKEAGVLHKNQQHIAIVCKVVQRGFAVVGIVALVDEATGYQDQRPKDELSKILEAYIAEELRPWIKTFPDEFFKQIYRLQGWEYTPGSAKRTPYVGKLINKYIYEKLPPGVLTELRSKNPISKNGYRKHKHFQFLTADTGNPHLDRQITAVTTILKISDTRNDFERHFEKAFPPRHIQHKLPLVFDIETEKEKE